MFVVVIYTYMFFPLVCILVCISICKLRLYVQCACTGVWNRMCHNVTKQNIKYGKV